MKLIQVQKGAPAKLLLGTDILPQLGYVLIQSIMESEDLNLLGSECHPSSGKQGNPSEVQPDVNVQYGESKDVASKSNVIKH